MVAQAPNKSNITLKMHLHVNMKATHWNHEELQYFEEVDELALPFLQFPDALCTKTLINVGHKT